MWILPFCINISACLYYILTWSFDIFCQFSPHICGQDSRVIFFFKGVGLQEEKLWETRHLFLFYLSQFLSMGPAQREAVWRALKDDAEKLLAESSGSPDRDSRRLKDELSECQQIFNRLSAEAAARGVIVICHLFYIFPWEGIPHPPPLTPYWFYP